MSVLILWICLLHFGSAKEICIFDIDTGSATLKCEESPTARDICKAREHLNNRNISGITELVMSECEISKLSPRTFDFNITVNIQVLELCNNILTSLPENLFDFKSLTDLEQLYLQDNELSYLEPKQFKHLQNLKLLDLSNNRFKTLLPGLFTSVSINDLNLEENEIYKLPDDFLAGNISSSLKELRLGGNKLTQVPHFYLPQLQFLDLDYNNVAELPTGLFNSTHSLTDIVLSYNSLNTLPEYFFYSQASPKLQKVIFSSNNIADLPDKLFNSSYLQNLSVIDFSHNNIADLPDKLFNSSYLQNLSVIDFSHNNIVNLSDKLFQSPYLQNLKIIDLSYNQIVSIPFNFLKNKALQYLEFIHLNDNNIKSITEEMLPIKMLRLTFLNLANNKISSIGKIIRKVLGNFDLCREDKVRSSLDVSHNCLTVQQTYFIHPSNTTSSIEGYLDLSDNEISKFELMPDSVEFTKLPYVGVPLQHVWIKTSGNKPFSVVNLVKAAFNIDLNRTDIKDINLREPKFYKEYELIRLHVLIKAFPYEYDCNCDMIKYLKLLELDLFNNYLRRLQIISETYFPIDLHSILVSDNILKNLKCGAPKHLSGKYLHQLKKVELQCEHYRCTDNKKCRCTETPFNKTLRIFCTKIQINHMPFIQQVSSKLEIFVGYNDIYQFPVTDFTESIQVVLLDISYNYITHIPSSFFSHYPNMTHLNLAGNRLTAIPSASEWKNLNAIQVLELRENNFTCNCSALKLKETLISLNQKAAVDLKNIKCSFPLAVKGKVIYSLPDVFFGCPVVSLFILTFNLSVLLFISVAMFIAYVFRYYVKLFLFIHFGWRFCYSYTKEETLYDAFISYSTKDSDWVINHLVNPLENLHPPYNLCLHERDFMIGEPICENIRKAVEGSKCTICVVSKNWLESEWCQFEFRVAHGVAIVEKQIRLLVILKEEIPKNKITGYLKFYMKTFTYLDSAHSLFWSRLLNDLPRPDVENIREENDQRDVIELM